MRWSPPELLDTERYGFERSGPTKMGDIYSMSMTAYQVSPLQCELGRIIEVFPGSHGYAPVSRVQ